MAMADIAPHPLTAKPDTPAIGRSVLVLAPTGDDSALITGVLADRGFHVRPIRNLADFVGDWHEELGVLVLAIEALTDPSCCETLRDRLECQEPWSEVPIVLLGVGVEGETSHVRKILGERMQLLLLERPLSISTLVSAIEAAAKSRRRQYEVRSLLEALRESADIIARTHAEANRAKDEFLASLAHELRSPMTAIRGWIQMLKSGRLDDQATAEALSLIEASTKVQAHIVEDLMDVSRILAGKMMVKLEVIELAPVVEAVITTFAPSASEQMIALTFDVPDEPILVCADEARLQQVGWNLISNSIKFTPEGGSVHVALSREGERAVIRVRDTGRGISPELLPHVFERYRQDAHEGRSAGLGLGLAIVRHLVESHDGTIEAFSEGLGRGAEFAISLPLHQ
jgi:signal transduction histidine kinase